MKALRLALAALALNVTTVYAADDATEARSPTAYQCKGADIDMDYSVTSIDGTPRLSLTYQGTQLNYQGDGIMTEETVMGEMAEVLVKLLPDVSKTTASLVIPKINLVKNNSLKFQTVVVLTTTLTPSIAIPYEGVINKSRYVKVNCVARFLVF